MLFYSVVLGAIGPVIAFTVPSIRERFGYHPPEPIPTTYPRASSSLSPTLARASQMLTFYISLLLGSDSPEATETAGAGL